MPWTEKKTMDGMSYYLDTDTQEVSWHKPLALMSAEEVEENKGEWVWVPHPSKVWQEARVQKRDDDGTVHVLLNNGSLLQIPPSRELQGKITNGRKQIVPLWELKKGNLRFLEDDLVMLDPVNEAFIIHDLQQRYAQKQIYTWVGASNTVLVSVNPYQDLGLYSQDFIDLHKNRPPNKAIPPHVFDIANDSYRSMVSALSNQSVLISGESGAGKTEATKQCLQYLASIAGSKESQVEEKILVANPLLEAFGNAKTIRNINSSRFGKWMEVFFDKQTAVMQGGKITNYLLERSRVVHQQKDERNFHIFYQLCKDKQCASDFALSTPEDFHYLAQSGCVNVPQIDDERDFAAVQKAMELLEFSEIERKSVLSLTAATLWLGNIDLEAKEQPGGVSGSEVKKSAAADKVAELLEMDLGALEKILCFRTIRPKAGKESAVIPLAQKEAKAALDSLAMGIYGKLFSWMVSRVNDALGTAEGRFIGILDIFGFEIFENNSFEQLCINFANEKLQQLFNKTTFMEEEELYEREGVKYTPIVFLDNQPVLNLIEEKRTGILPLLDDEQIIPEGSDQKFMAKIENFHNGKGIFQADDHRRFANSLSFEIKHYAGVVKYDASLFMTKNVDTVFEDMYQALQQSKNALLQNLFQEGNQRIKTLSYQFRGQLDELMKTLNVTESRFIRCIKPNDDLQPDKFISATCIEQLRYSGVFEAVNIRKTGYPFRYTHKRFIYRYGCINFGYKYKTDEADEVKRIKEIFKASKQDFSGCQIGDSMVLYRANEYKLLKLLRNLSLEKIIPKIQGVMKGGSVRRYTKTTLGLNKVLKKFIKKANDYDGLTDAIQKASSLKDNHDPLLLKLYRYEVPNLAVAQTLRKDLKWWKDLEQKMQTLKEKCDAAKKPDKYYEDLKRVEKDFEGTEKTQGKRAKDAKVNFYGMRQYVQPRPTKVQRDLLKVVKELIRLCILGQLDERVAKAVNNLDRKEIEGSLEKADELKHFTKMISEAREWLKKFEALDEEARKAMKCVSKSMLAEVDKKAVEFKQKNVILTEAKKMLDMDEKPFVELEYARATEVGDNERKIHREIRLMEFKYDGINHDQVSLDKMGGYRSEVEYAKAKMMSKVMGGATLRMNMKKHTTKAIPTSLTVPAFETATLAEDHVKTPEENIKIKEFKTVAKQNFKSILMYMGDKKTKGDERTIAANDILARGLRALKNKDDDMLREMYLQVIKQLTSHPQNTGDAMDWRLEPEATGSFHNGLALLAMMLSVFPPSSQPYEINPVATHTFDDAIVVWITKNIVSEDRKRYLSALHNSKYGKPSANVPEPLVVRNQFAELKGKFALDQEKDSGPEEQNIQIYLK